MWLKHMCIFSIRLLFNYICNIFAVGKTGEKSNRVAKKVTDVGDIESVQQSSFGVASTMWKTREV